MADKDFRWLTPTGKKFLSADYLLPNQTVTQRVKIIADKAALLLGNPDFAVKFIDYMQRGWYSLSTPIWTNFGTERGLPISCFGSVMDDSMESILFTHAEIGMMSKYGGGTSVYYGLLRSRGSSIKDNGASSGSVHFASLAERDAKYRKAIDDAEREYIYGSVDDLVNVISQGKTRRGSCAVWLPVEHKDILEFLDIRSEGNPIQNLNFGVTVSDAFMKKMIAGDSQARTIWAKVIEARTNTGYPYIMFSDNANNGAPEIYKDRNKKILASNLCSEIMLPSNPKESFVCDLSSMNILYYDEWKDTDAVEVLTFFLDVVMTEFIEKASTISFMTRAVRFAERHRAIGIGWLGWHSYLQQNMIPFESMEAKYKNVEIACAIQKQAYEASAKLAGLFGEPMYLKGIGRRNATLCAIAPTKSSAFILGQVSEGIEPHRANYYIKDLAKGKFTVRNPQLESLLESKGQNTEDVWDSILRNRGSVAHLEILNDFEKSVFKTFQEISPTEIIIQASARQRFIDQGQSLNLIIPPTTPIRDINALYIKAWELGIKSLYYQISVNAAQELSRSVLDCVSCSS